MRRLSPAILLMTASAQPASSPQVDWRWERDTPTCTLRQTVSADGTTVSVSRTAGNDQTSISVGGEQPSYEPPDTFRGAKIIFDPDGQASDAIVYVTKRKGGRDVFAISEDTNFLTKFGQSSGIEFTQAKLESIETPVRSAAAAVSAIRSCEEAKMREWGIDPVAWRALKARPLPVQPWTDWLSGDDYPASAVLKGVEGFVIPKMLVGADGSVLSCESIRRNRSPTYRDKICEKLKKRARFRPALDANGNPVSAPFIFVIKFRLE